MTDSLPTTQSGPLSVTILSADDIAEFQSLLEREAGVRLDTSAAWKRATQLVSLVRMLLGPIPEDPEAVSLDSGAVRRHAPLADGVVDG
jgi:hypothetical protein